MKYFNNYYESGYESIQEDIGIAIKRRKSCKHTLAFTGTLGPVVYWPSLIKMTVYQLK